MATIQLSGLPIFPFFKFTLINDNNINKQTHHTMADNILIVNMFWIRGKNTCKYRLIDIARLMQKTRKNNINVHIIMSL